MKDIAIIGISGRFPEAKNIQEFRKNLIQGRDSVREFSFERKANTTLDLQKEFKDIAFMEDIDLFDHKFFNISRSEAEFMDPHQRVILEVVYEAIENSGYASDHFSGTETAVFIGDTDQEYYKLADRFDPTILTGNTSATTAGRIARFFNFRGNAMMLDTACSSSLLAVHMACNELNFGEAEYAIACGVRFILFPEEKKVNLDLGIMANDGKTKSFSAKADGSGAGEAVACVLLKPLEKAVADHDLIYAVIKGTAANQDAQLSGSLTAPSSQAQSEVIEKAWKKAGIDPTTISYIETHGSGTKLGDPIEIAGIDQAFKDKTNQKQFCAVSSVKTNIGHTGGSAGISGLIKAILSLQHQELYPSLHFDVPNPFIDFKNSVVYVNRDYKTWESNDNQLRRAGVSSFGLSGTNCHVILEEFPRMEHEKFENETNLFTFSAKTKASLSSYLTEFKGFLSENPNLSFSSLAYTLNHGRNHYNYRLAITADGQEELRKKLDEGQISSSAKSLKKLLFLFSDNVFISENHLSNFCAQFSSFKAAYEECVPYSSPSNEIFRRFAFQYAYYKLLESSGIQTENLLGIGSGDSVVAAILGELSLKEAIEEALVAAKVDHSDIQNRLQTLVERETELEKVAFIEMGYEGVLSRGLKDLSFPDRDELYVVFSLDENTTNYLEIIRDLYLENYTLNWNKIYADKNCERMLIPNYSFEKTRCWLKEPLQMEDFKTNQLEKKEEGLAELLEKENDFNPDSIQHLIHEEWSEIERKIAAIWIEVLKLDELNLDDDFFRLGGHSLMATRVISRIEKEYGIKLVFKDIFTFATVRALAKGVDELLKSGKAGFHQNEIQKTEEKDYYPLSHAQKRLWLLHEMDNGKNIAYNLPASLRVEGEISQDKLQTIFENLINRHESLRTVFEENKGEVVQKIVPHVDFQIEIFQASEREIETVYKSFLRPFDLTKAPLLRIGLLRFSEKDQLVLFDMHHIISDGVSLGVLTSEFLDLYKGKTLAELKLQYKDFATWQEEQFISGKMKVQEEFWLKCFEQSPPELDLFIDFPRPPQKTYEGKTAEFEISAEILADLKHLAQQSNATLYMVLLSVYTVFLSKISTQEDIVVGSPIAGRPEKDAEAIIGMFVNTIPMRNHASKNKSFVKFLAEVKENCINAYQHQDYPFELILEKLNLKTANNRNPLFDTLFVLQNLDVPELSLEDVVFTPYKIDSGAVQFDLTMEVNEYTDYLSVKLMYKQALFEDESIAIMQERFLSLIQEIILNPTKKIGELDSAEFSDTNKDINIDFDLNF